MNEYFIEILQITLFVKTKFEILKTCNIISQEII